MSGALKDRLDTAFLEKLAAAFQEASNDFNYRKFNQILHRVSWVELELKGRISYIADALRESLPSDYPTALNILLQVASQFTGLPAFVFPAFVERHGSGHWEHSMRALEVLTQYSTGEFAVRPFFLIDPERMATQMLAWSAHTNYHVRRLASEGMRPRLPWGQALKHLKRDPSPCLPVLERLKTDPELYVRKSVANHLNDIGKDHPDLLIKIARSWKGQDPRTDWIIKHALRSLLKKGDTRALKITGVSKGSKVHARSFALGAKSVRLGGVLEYEVALEANGKSPVPVRLDLALHYVRKGEGMGRKVFKIFERRLAGKLTIKRRLSFRPMTTRRHLPGRHYLSLIINGSEAHRVAFELKEK